MFFDFHFYANFLLLLTHSSCHPHHHHYRWTFQPFFLCSKFSIFPSLTRSLARCQVMKQSIKNYVMNFFFEFLHHGRKQQEGFYKLILFNLNLFIAKNFFIMRLFPPRRCFFYIVRNYNENFQKKKINDLRDEGERNYSFMMMMVMGSAVKAFFSEPHTHTNHI